MQTLDIPPFLTLPLISERASRWPGDVLGEGAGFIVAFIAVVTSVVILLVLLPLIVRKARRGDQTIEDSEAAVRHFLPF